MSRFNDELERAMGNVACEIKKEEKILSSLRLTMYELADLKKRDES